MQRPSHEGNTIARGVRINALNKRKQKYWSEEKCCDAKQPPLEKKEKKRFC